MLGCLPAVTSCVMEKAFDAPGSGDDDDKLYVYLNITPLNSVVNTTATDNEYVKSLRIVLLSDGMIERNEYVPLDQLAVTLTYRSRMETVEGRKEFYLIANEESVGPVSFMPSDGVSLPNPLPEGTLHQLLESYTPEFSVEDVNENTGGTSDNAPTKGEELAALLNAVYFSPEYTAGDDGRIYLPYVSYYGTYDIEKGVDHSLTNPDGIFDPNPNPINMYLVPVATKFTFNFTNYREDAVNINEITINSVNSQNYLLARVGENDMTKRLPGSDDDLYWIDWLGEVSHLSQSNAGFYPNINFNGKYGWITDYALPFETETNTANQYTFIGGNIQGFKVLGGAKDNPYFCTVGPFYIPESKNFYNPITEQNEDEQAYYLTFNFEDTKVGEDPQEYQYVNISNLKALFRNTHVIINIKMEPGPIKVYAEIAPWIVKSINGWVTEGGVPNPNPFKIKAADK